jgi:hypothetical protein
MQALIFLLAAVLATPAQDPVQVSATLTRDRIAVGEATTLQVSVDTRGAAVDEIHAPTLPGGLDVLGTSDFSQTQISMPGGRTRLTRRDIVLSARAPGVYRIPAFTIRVEGRTYRTRPLDLVVAGPGAAIGPITTRPGGVPASSFRLHLYPDTVFVGQQVLLSAEVTFGDDLRYRPTRRSTFEPPAPTGFWVQDLPDPLTTVVRVQEGRTIESQTYHRAYFPLAAGEFVFPPAQLHYDVRRGFLNPPETRRLSSDSARLVVLPLPQEDRPADFSGAVGRLEIRGAVRPERIAAGEAAVLEIELEGRGNVRGLREPALPPLGTVDVFPPTQESTVRVEGQRVGGTKRFRWVVVPSQAGTLEIPPVEYSYFDPELRQYVRVRTEPLRLEAEPRPGEVGAPDTVLRPLRRERGGEPLGWARSRPFAAAQLVPVLLVGVLALVRRRRDRPPGPVDHERRLRRALGALRGRTDLDAALPELERLLHETARCLAGTTAEDSVAGLRAHGRGAAADMLAALLHEIRQVRYSPAHAPVDMGALLDRAAQFLEQLAPPRHWRHRRAAAGSIMLLLAAASVLAAGRAGAGAAAAQETQGRTSPDLAFDAGVAAFHSGDYAAATRSFHVHARRYPRDPHGWYNLGLSALRAGDSGRAVWAWLRGLRLAPRDDDLLHNLRLTASSAAIAQVRPRDRLAPTERVALAAAAWWLLVFGLAGWARSRTARGTAAGAAALLAAVGLSAAAAAYRPPLVTPLRAAAPLYAGPTIRDERLGSLQAGTLARIEERRDEWLLVSDDGGRRGWVERNAVATP